MNKQKALKVIDHYFDENNGIPNLTGKIGRLESCLRALVDALCDEPIEEKKKPLWVILRESYQKELDLVSDKIFIDMAEAAKAHILSVLPEGCSHGALSEVCKDWNHYLEAVKKAIQES